MGNEKLLSSTKALLNNILANAKEIMRFNNYLFGNRRTDRSHNFSRQLRI